MVFYESPCEFYWALNGQLVKFSLDQQNNYCWAKVEPSEEHEAHFYLEVCLSC